MSSSNQWVSLCFLCLLGIFSIGLIEPIEGKRMTDASTINGDALQAVGGKEYNKEDAEVASNVKILGDIDGIMSQILDKKICVFTCKPLWTELKEKLGLLKKGERLTPDEAKNPVVDNIKLKFLTMVDSSSKVRFVLKAANKLTSVSDKLKTLCPLKVREGMNEHKLWNIVKCKKEDVEATSSEEDLIIEEEVPKMFWSSVADTFEHEKGHLEQEMKKEHDTDFAGIREEIAPYIQDMLAQFALDDEIHRQARGHDRPLSLAEMHQDSVGATMACGVVIFLCILWGLGLVCAVSFGGR